MTQEDKNILLKELCARSYYQPFVQLNPGAYNKPEKCWICGISGEDIYLNVDSDPFSLRNFNILPYLRPMSSMTDDEIDRMWEIYESGPAAESSAAVTDYLYERHLDCNHLIEKGLALEAPEDMYKKD